MGLTGTEVGEQHASETKSKLPLWKRLLKGLAIGTGVTLVIAAALGVLLYNFGGMSGSVYPEMEPRYDRLVAAGQAAPIQKRFVIPIPGCQCHSTDPVLTAEHSRRHMNECGSCHNTSPAHMEPGVL
jgi:hypothetical protein